MKTLVYKSDRYSSGFEEIPGHGCVTDADFQAYVDEMPGFATIVDAPFDPGVFVPAEQRPKKDILPKLTERLKTASPEEKARIMDGLGQVLAALRGPLDSGSYKAPRP